MYTFSNRRRKNERKKLDGKNNSSKQNKIKDRIMRDIRALFELENEDYYKPIGVSNLSLYEFVNKIKPYVRNVIIGLQNSDTWKIHLTIAINFI